MNSKTASVSHKSNSIESLLVSKVPQVTIFFWIIKVLCTTVGETAADYLNVNLNLGLTGTSVVTGVLLAFAFALQFKSSRYRPALYWVTVALVSVFGTLVTDNLTDHVGVKLETSTIIFSVLLAATFAIWYKVEKTLDIHFIFTARREAFYWLAVLLSFALGTATGDLVAEALGVGYFRTGLIVIGIIAAAAAARKFHLNSVLSFWIIYVMTRPLGASIGDYLSQPTRFGGLGLGTTKTSAIFVSAIIATVVYLSVTKADITARDSGDRNDNTVERGGLLQTAIVVSLFLALAIPGYYLRKASLNTDIATTTPAAESTPIGQVTSPSNALNNGSGPTPTAATGPLGDLSNFKTIAYDTLNFVNSNDQSGAQSRVDDLEHDWDAAQARLKTKNKAKWTEVDDRIDAVLRAVRAVNPNVDTEKSALTDLISTVS